VGQGRAGHESKLEPRMELLDLAAAAREWAATSSKV